MNMTLFRDLYDRADEDGVISMDLIGAQAARRWAYSVANNPNFYYGPVSGMVSRYVMLVWNIVIPTAFVVQRPCTSVLSESSKYLIYECLRFEHFADLTHPTGTQAISSPDDFLRTIPRITLMAYLRRTCSRSSSPYMKMRKAT